MVSTVIKIWKHCPFKRFFYFSYCCSQNIIDSIYALFAPSLLFDWVLRLLKDLGFKPGTAVLGSAAIWPIVVWQPVPTSPGAAPHCPNWSRCYPTLSQLVQVQPHTVPTGPHTISNCSNWSWCYPTLSQLVLVLPHTAPTGPGAALTVPTGTGAALDCPNWSRCCPNCPNWSRCCPSLPQLAKVLPHTVPTDPGAAPHCPNWFWVYPTLSQLVLVLPNFPNWFWCCPTLPQLVMVLPHTIPTDPGAAPYCSN